MSQTTLPGGVPEAALHLEVADPTGLLNKYALPKVAMVTIGVAAAVGCLLTVAVGAGMGYVAAAAAYLLLMAAGTAAGGLFWHRFVADPARRLADDPEAEGYAERQEAIFTRLEQWCWPAAAVGLVGFLPSYAAHTAPGDTGVLVSSVLAVICLLAWGASVAWRRCNRHTAAASAWSLLPAAGLLVAVGSLQAWHDDPGSWSVLVWRSLHLFAFAAWFGGAVWNVAIAVRAARDRLSVPVVVTAHLQLERFRRVVRIALPLVLMTGLLQLHDFYGWDVRGATAGPFGHLVLLKLGLIALLVVIFNTCPMWHACSPIAGMCSLDDLDPNPSAGRAGRE